MSKLLFSGLLGLLIFNPSLKAEVITWEAPLVFNLDWKGPGIFESEEISTEGVVTSISLSACFKGEVKLEVSADGAKHYTRIVNGQPLLRGFVPGRRLRFRATLSEDSFLSRVILRYQDTSGLSFSFGQPLLSGFKYRRSIFIDNPRGEDIFNYQVKLKLSSAQVNLKGVISPVKTERNFQDVLFTLADRETILASYLEKIEKNKYPLATFWVKIPQIPPEGIKLYIYYGNPLFKGYSSQEVFDFYDDFGEEELDLKKWEVKTGLRGEVSISSHKELILKEARIKSRVFKLKNGVLEFKARLEKNTGLEAMVRSSRATLEDLSLSQTVYASTFKGAEHTVGVSNIARVNIGNPPQVNQDYIFQIIAEGLNLTFIRRNTSSGKKEAELHFSDIGGLTRGFIGFKADTLKDSRVYIDWIRVRKYVSPEPEVTRVFPEEKLWLPEFKNLTLSEKGIFYNDKGKKGVYISSPLKLEFLARVVKMEFPEQASLKVALSLDGGKSFLEGVVPDRYYYACRDGFLPGNLLVYKLEFSSWLKERAGLVGRVRIEYRPGSITLISPASGETLLRGSVIEILWSAQDYEPDYPLKLEYSLDGGKTFKTIVEKTANSGSFFWKVPPQASRKVLFKISDAYAPEVYDISQGFIEFK